MSTNTPRTDAKCNDYAGPLSFVGDEQFLPASFARELERELAKAQADKARLDLMEANAAEVRVEWDDGDGPIPPEFSIIVRGTGVIGRGPTLRAAIDEARKISK